jgi:lysine 2,3-aminomutase
MEDTESLKNQRQTATEQTPDADDPLPKSSEKTQQFKNKFYPEISSLEWNDWKWQIRNSITTYEELQRIFESSETITSNEVNLPLRITPYYASLITDLEHSIGKCVIPTSHELFTTVDEEGDFLHEEKYSPVPNIVHRYPDRVLFLTTDFCSSYCRYCTRSRMVSKSEINRKIWDKGIEYIKNHKEIRDVLLSGGDIFTMEDNNIEYLLKNIRAIEHVEFLRIGTKVPVVLPQRITKKLAKMLSKYHPLFISIHFTHPDELTLEVKEACAILANAGIPLGSQTVLLKDINDNVDVMKRLMHGLLKIRVRPYYIYQCDRVNGTSHFRTPISKGLEIIRMLQGHTSGYAIPRFIVDSNLGKIDLSPNNIISHEDDVYKLSSFTGEILTYEE